MAFLEVHPSDAAPNIALTERRKYPRLSVAVPIEFKTEGASFSTRTQTSDVSCGGCYVESNFSMAVGTKLELVLWLDDVKLAARGITVTHHPGFGNGIQFLDMSVEDLNRLNRFLSSALR